MVFRFYDAKSGSRPGMLRVNGPVGSYARSARLHVLRRRVSPVGPIKPCCRPILLQVVPAEANCSTQAESHLEAPSRLRCCDDEKPRSLTPGCPCRGRSRLVRLSARVIHGP